VSGVTKKATLCEEVRKIGIGLVVVKNASFLLLVKKSEVGLVVFRKLIDCEDVRNTGTPFVVVTNEVACPCVLKTI
jgi:hypothetical protein